MEENEKPLKLGQLWMMASSGFKKSFKSRFCILTSNIQLIWYKKQEDHMEGRKGGSIKKLDSCVLDEAGIRTLPSGGEIFCFTVNKNLIGTETERERVNWIVEILKFRGIGGLIEIVNDEKQKLRRHAAYALCNLAGRSRDDSQIRIVRENGVHCLLEFQKTIDEPDLIDSINYALCKLSTQEENKPVLAMNLGHLFGLILSTNERWMDFGLQTIENCSTNVDVQKKIFQFGGVKTLLDVFCRDEPLKESLLLLTANCILNCLENGESKKLVTENIERITNTIEKLPPPAQEAAIKILIKCMIGENNSVVSEAPVGSTLIPLIVSTLETLQESLLYLLATLTSKKSHRVSLRCSDCIQNILVTVSSTNKNIVQYSLEILRAIWCKKKYVADLAMLGTELHAFIPLIDADTSIMKLAVEILKCLSAHDSSLAYLSQYRSLLGSVLPKLLKLQRTNTPALGDILTCVVHLSKCATVKTILCQQSLLSQLLEQLSECKENREIIFSNLSVLRNCATTGLGKIYIRLYHGLDTIVSFASSQDKEILRVTLELLGLLMCSRKTRAKSGKILDSIIPLLSDHDDSIQELACTVIENLAFDHAVDLTEAVRPLVALLESSCDSLILKALNTLLNFCSVQSSMAILLVDGFPKLLKIITNPAPEIQQRSILLMAITLSETTDIEFDQKELLPLLSNHLGDAECLLTVLYALSQFCHSESNRHFVVTTNLIAQIYKLALGGYSLVSQLALEIMTYCVPHISVSLTDTFLNLQCIKSCVEYLNSPSEEMRNHALQILYHCSKLKNCKQHFNDSAKANLYKIACNVEQNQFMASKILLNLAKIDNNGIPVTDVNALISLLQSCHMVAPDKNLTGLHLSLNGRALQLQCEQKTILQVDYPNEGTLSIAAAKGSSTIKTAKPDAPDPQRSEESPQVQRKRKTRTKSKHGSRGFVIGARSRIPRSRSSTTSDNMKKMDSDLDSPKKYFNPYHYQIHSLVEYKFAIDKNLAESRKVFYDLASLELIKHIQPMETLLPCTNELAVRFQESSCLRVDQRNPNTCLISAEYIGSTESFYPLLEAVQSKQPFSQNSPINYFEIFVASAGRTGSIGIGVTLKDYPLDQQPGWCPGGWGYHGDDGNKYWYTDQCNNDFYGPCFSVGDFVGCGVNNVTSQVFFTKNGYVIDVLAFDNLPLDKEHLYPFVCLGSKGEKIFLNFGQIPFLWNYDIENTLTEVTAAPKAEYNQQPPKLKRETVRTYENALRSLLKKHPMF